MTETTTEQLAEIEGQAESTPVTEYTPPEGWRVLAVGEVLQDGDVWINQEGEFIWPTKRVGGTVNDQRYIRPIEPEPQPEPEPVPEPEAVQVREGRWRTRNGLVKDVTAMPRNHEDFAAAYPWWDGVSTWRNDGRWLAGGSTMDLLEYLGPIEQQPQPEPDTELQAQVAFLKGREVTLGTRLQQEKQVTTGLSEQLETVKARVNDLETINDAQLKAFTAANKENTALRNQLAAVKAELASVAADRQQLRVELDAAQQVPADSPELRQLRADLAEVTRERDQYLDSYQRIFGDLETIRETTKAETVETIAEWLQAFRGCNSPALALLLLEALPSIMRHLTGLDSPEDVD